MIKCFHQDGLLSADKTENTQLAWLHYDVAAYYLHVI